MQRSKQIEDNLSIFLNISRAMAAILVLAGHLRGFFFEPYANLNPSDQNLINYLLFFITRIGHECVIVFFVLSGYLVGGNLTIDFINKQLNWKKYFTDRGIRMWTVLLPALLIGYLLDLYRCTQLNDCFQVTPFDLKNVLGNLFFLQTIQVPIFTSNVALWSLANEFWYYLIFPILLYPIAFKAHWSMKVLIITIIILLAYWFMPHIIQLFPLWLLGVGIRLITLPEYFKKIIFLPVLYVLLLASIYVSNTNSTVLTNFIVGITFSLLILYHQNNRSVNCSKLKGIASFFSEFSFSIYAIHLPIMFALLAIMYAHSSYSSRVVNAGIKEWFVYLVLFIIILVVSFFFYFITEKHTYLIRKKVYNLVKSE
jgi:peptidoglycan/LPS O-acetylase OafA/YrhL